MNLVIGSTSQLSNYFPREYLKISSRDIDFNQLKNQKWDSVYITFAEQRIYDENIDYIYPNYLYTLDIINSLLDASNKIVCYTSCELWAQCAGKISSSTEPKFRLINNDYTISKLLLFNKIKNLRKYNEAYNKVIFMHPFYFNSIHRSNYFLFGKIYDSIINKKKIQVGNLNFYRDMVHASFIVEQSMSSTQDSVVGAGRLFNVRQFIQDLYKINNVDFDSFVIEESKHLLDNQKLIMADVVNDYTYEKLIFDTQQEILNYK
jgi:GDP-D-mannose dehydratase